MKYNSKYHPSDESTRPAQARKQRHAAGNYSQPQEVINIDSSNEEAEDAGDDLDMDDNTESSDDSAADGTSIEQSPKPQASRKHTKDQDTNNNGAPRTSYGPWIDQRPSIPRPSQSRSTEPTRMRASTSTTADGTIIDDELPLASPDEDLLLSRNLPSVTFIRTIKERMSLAKYSERYVQAWEESKRTRSLAEEVERLRTSYSLAWETAQTEDQIERAALHEDEGSFDQSFGEHGEEPLGELDDDDEPTGSTLLGDQLIGELQSPGDDTTRRSFELSHSTWRRVVPSEDSPPPSQKSFEHQPRESDRVIADSQDAWDCADVNDYQNSSLSKDTISKETASRHSPIPSQEPVAATPAVSQRRSLFSNRDSEDYSFKSIHSSNSALTSAEPNSRPDRHQSSQAVASTDSSSMRNKSFTSSTSSHETVPTQPSSFLHRHGYATSQDQALRPGEALPTHSDLYGEE